MRKPPASDLQQRLRYIENECDGLVKYLNDDTAASNAVKRLAYLVGYIAGIVEKHLKDGEN
jgi:hypothetical protein